MSVCWNAWPMCSVPVTLGGGSWMQYGVPSPPAANQPLDSQCAYQRPSTAFGSKLLSSAMLFLLVRAGFARGEGVLDGLAHRAAQLLLQLRAQAGDLLVELRDEAHDEHALDVRGERFVARGVVLRRGRVLLHHVGEQRHLLDGAQRILLLALHQRVDARDELVRVLPGVFRVLLRVFLFRHAAALARSWLRIS